jgi:hypothetical protein
MRGLKSFFGGAGLLMPVLYCGGLVYYFLDFSDSVQQAQAMGLGPTVLVLGVVGLLFSIPLILKTTRLVSKARAGARAERDGDDAFDADAAIARYKTRQAEEPPPPPSNAPVAPRPSQSAPRTSFGRRNR